MKDLYVFEKSKAKNSSDLPDYKDTPTFQSFLLADNYDKKDQDSKKDLRFVSQLIVSTAALISQADSTVKSTSKIRDITLPFHASSKAKDILSSCIGPKAKNPQSFHVDQKVNDVKKNTRV